VNIIIPLTVTDAAIAAGTTVAEPSPGETAWAASTDYAVGDVRIRAATHRRYRCAAAHTSAASPAPEADPTRWLDIGPTNRWAPFDAYTNTAATATTSLSYVLRPGFFNACALYGLSGASYTFTVRDAPGGTEIYSRSGFLVDDPLGWYEYLFVPPRVQQKLLFTDIPIRPDAEATFTLSAAAGVQVGVGMIVLGDYAALFGGSGPEAFGGTQYGAQAEPISYSFIRTAEDGTTTIVRRHSATNLRAAVAMPQRQADVALQMVQQVLDVPVAWVASSAPCYQGLTTFGLGTASLSYASPGHAVMDLTVKGLI